MNSRPINLQFLWFLAALTLTACTWIAPPTPALERPGTDGPAAATAIAALANHPLPPADCPVTQPNGRTPPGEQAFPQHHGNDALLTALWPNGVVLIDPGMVMPDGTLGMKWPWWRLTPGKLSVEGRRLDEEAPPLEFDASDGYGDSGFQPSGLLFPTEGCWEVTGRVGDGSLTFVTWVQRR